MDNRTKNSIFIDLDKFLCYSVLASLFEGMGLHLGHGIDREIHRPWYDKLIYKVLIAFSYV